MMAPGISSASIIKAAGSYSIYTSIDITKAKQSNIHSMTELVENLIIILPVNMHTVWCAGFLEHTTHSSVLDG